MNPYRRLSCVVAVLAVALCAWADQKPAPGTPGPISKQDRMLLIRNLNAEFVYLRKPLPLGGHGIVLTPNGAVMPGDQELRQMVADFGPAGKIGDRVQITDVVFKEKSIVFEINGGPVKKKKWYQRIEVGGMGGMTPVTPGPDNSKAYGSFIVLQFRDFIPGVTADQVKQMLGPVLDFNSLSAAESFSKSMPPIVANAIKDHKVLVGMDRQMVEYAKGRPDNKIREKDQDGVPYEEWIYGAPPAEVQFVRFTGDEVTRLEIMTVDGQKVVRTQKEVDLSGMKPKPEEAESSQPKPADSPSLRRPGEQPEKQTGPTVVQTRSDPQKTSGPPGMPQPSPTGVPGDTTGTGIPPGPGNPTGPPGGPPDPSGQDPTIPH